MNVLKIFHKTAIELSKDLPLGKGLDFVDRPYESIGNKASSISIIKKQTVKEIIEEGEHWGITGKTGSGKTYFTKALIKAKKNKNNLLNIYHLDTKKRGDFTERDGPMYRSYDPPNPIRGRGQTQIWQPSVDSIEAYSAYFQGILDAGLPAIVNTDEAKNIVFNGRVPRGYELLLSQGRLPGIHTMTSTQEVAQAPRQMFSQASHIVCFRVFNSYDESRMKQYLKIYNKGPLPLAGKHSFLYMRPDLDGEPILFTDYRDFIARFL